MAALLSGLLSLRHSRRLARVPPYLSLLCIVIGVAWLLLLPLDEYSRRTYVSENAILPGQVHTYFGGSEHNVFRAYRQEVAAMDQLSPEDRAQKLYHLLGANGLKPDIQNYSYDISGQNKTGQNVYALLQGPRADATEAMVLIAAWRNMDDKVNYSGVALLLTLARYFKRWSIWSKDIIVLIPSDSTYGPHAWVDAYHDTHDTTAVQPLNIKAGALQAAIAVDYPAGPWGHRFEKLHVVYDGINGQLPNLDLVNTAVNIAQGQLGITCTIQRMWDHKDSYRERLDTMLRGMMNQAVGHASGPHSVFMPYHVDAITLQTVGDGWHDEISLGRTVESLLRSVNNLLEHLHQSFFFYLLMQANRFVSIGTYLPSAMLIAV
ncbi:Glycosylphosphatidylinositol:protein transamidase, GAA1 component, partial [Aureobasidium melanogenum]